MSLHDQIQEHKLRRQYGLHLVHLRPGGKSLEEQDHDDRRDDQAERLTYRIEEVMQSPDPLTGLFSVKLAHRGLGHDDLIDEAITECKRVFGFTDSKVKSASMLAMQKEAERKQRIRDLARSAARRAGMEVEDDDGESLIPRARNAAPVLSGQPATIEELTADQLSMGDSPQDAAKIAQARFSGRFGEGGRFIMKKENSNAGTGTDAGANRGETKAG